MVMRIRVSHPMKYLGIERAVGTVLEVDDDFGKKAISGGYARLDAAAPLTPTYIDPELRVAIAALGARSYAASQGVYLPSALAGAKWRRKRASALAGLSRAHIAIVGDSIAFGAAATGNTAPKNQTSYPGRLRAMLDKAGLWGGGWVICNSVLVANPTWDSRWSFGAGVTAPTGTGASGSFGFHRSATFQIPAGSYVEFTDTMDKVRIATGQGASGLYTVSVDGTSAGTVGNGSGVGTIAKVTDTDTTAYAPSQEVTVEISCGALASHTVRITAPAGADTYLLGVKPIVSGNGKIEVTNASVSTKSIYSLFSASTAHNDEVNGLYGLPMIDFLKADLLVFALGINDWQFGGARTLAGTLTDLDTVIARQTGSGNAPTGAVKANGDAMLLWNPEPDNSLNQSDATWEEWREGWYDVATAEGVPLLDLGGRWGGYASGVAAGLFADSIHPNDNGALDMVAAVHEAVLHRI